MPFESRRLRIALSLLLLLYCFPLRATDAAADARWRAVLDQAKRESKPILVVFRTPDCARCDEFERLSVPHPVIARRLHLVVFAVLPSNAERSTVALFDRTGVLRVRWPMVPTTTELGILIDSVAKVAPHFEEAARRIEAGAPLAADVDAAIGMLRLGHPATARTVLARAAKEGDAETQQRANEILQAIPNGAEASPPPPARRSTIRILPPSRQIVSGLQTVQTHVSSDAVARVTFHLDGRELVSVTRPPFSATIDFGAVPERHAVRVVAFDRSGHEAGSDERILNEAGETFRLRIVSPAEGAVEGAVRVSLNLRAPAARRVQRVVISWNEADRAVLTNAPWDATVQIPAGELGVLRAVAELDDGRTSEDAVLLNASGAAGRADVVLAELPLTIVGGGTIAPEKIVVREGARTRRVQSIATAAESPLTIGMLIDVSGSMDKTLPDLQEAAIRFLETILGPRDRAFLVAFDTRARLVQPATSDVALLRKRIMALRPDGLTALHDALVLGLLQFEGIQGRRAMVVFSDGHDVSSSYSAEEVGELARRVNVPIHVISALQDVPIGRIANVEPTDRELQRVAQSTGGTARLLQQFAELPDVYADIEAALRGQVLAFVRTEPATRENEWRSIRVEVEGMTVLAPAGYYAAW